MARKLPPAMLFVPDQGQPRALLLMLHGCTQNALDFARGTRMNSWGERGNFAVLYPEQSKQANSRLCWNWFAKAHQKAGAGEPAWLMDLTRQTTEQLNIPAEETYLAGLSAGACMAAILAARYPGSFSGLGLHSGVPLGAAGSMMGALLAMKGLSKWSKEQAWTIPTLILHGDQDAVVSVKNAARLARQAGLEEEAGEDIFFENGRRLRRKKNSRVECLVVEGLGHAWSGGSLEGSWTDPSGPDASAQLVRFFGLA